MKHTKKKLFRCPENSKNFRGNPKKMTTDELIKLADEIKSGMTNEWIKRREKVKSKPLLVQQA